MASETSSPSSPAGHFSPLPDNDTGLRLRFTQGLPSPSQSFSLSLPGSQPASQPVSTPASEDGMSRAPSLIHLNGGHGNSAPHSPETEHQQLSLKTKTKQSTRSRKHSKSQSMGSTKSAKSPLLDALRLPEINIPRPVQVQFAPLHIPPHRRLQTAAVAIWALLMPLALVIYFFALSLPFLWPIVVPYTIWALFIDTAQYRGGRPKESARRCFLWKYFAQYYPCSIVKEEDLPADRKYVFGYHPHGIIGMGAVATFGSEGTGFSEYFPGIKPHLLTLDSNFKIPVYRDIIMSLGISSVSKRSCKNILKLGPGNAITIVVGGAAESLSAHPGTFDLTLKRRLGFIKIAIREGADLVPVFSFGENDIYDQLANEKGSKVYKLQKQFQKIFGFTLPLFHGRGIFNYNYGLMPFRHPIVSVIGRPIKVEQCTNPSNEQLHAIQKLYIDELTRIWDKYKDLYAKNRTKELTLVE